VHFKNTAIELGLRASLQFNEDIKFLSKFDHLPYLKGICSQILFLNMRYYFMPGYGKEAIDIHRQLFVRHD
jgi:hypothetical protein